MTVRELREILEGCDDNDIVILSSDGEGNSYQELSAIETGSNWKNGEVGLRELTEDLANAGFEEGDLLEGEPCIILFP